MGFTEQITPDINAGTMAQVNDMKEKVCSLR